MKQLTSRLKDTPLVVSRGPAASPFGPVFPMGEEFAPGGRISAGSSAENTPCTQCYPIRLRGRDRDQTPLLRHHPADRSFAIDIRKPLSETEFRLLEGVLRLARTDPLSVTEQHSDLPGNQERVPEPGLLH